MPLADRFAEYVAELHELSNIHRISHGKPEDLARLLEAAKKSQSFAEEFGCVMRSIAVREHFRLSESELLTLVAVAWAGAEPDTSATQSSHLLTELGGILHKSLAQRVLSHRAVPIVVSAEAPEEAPQVFSDAPENREPEIKPDVPGNRQLSGVQAHDEGHLSATKDPVPAKRVSSLPKIESNSWGGVPQKSEPNRPAKRLQLRETPELDLTVKEDKSRALETPLFRDLNPTGERVPARRFDPSLAEVLAMGLTGLVVALLFSVGSLPIYRTRVSVYLPSMSASATDPGTNAGGSQNQSLLNGELTEKVAQLMLASPQAKSILRQDVVSRGMRDLHVGGDEPILYADLLTETARQVKVTHLQPQNLYAITCDSWSAQFATTFCNQLTASLEEPSSGAISSQPTQETSRTIDAALQPGIQIYPRWYLQGSMGLAVGCLVGLLVSLLTRPSRNPVQENDIGA